MVIRMVQFLVALALVLGLEALLPMSVGVWLYSYTVHPYMPTIDIARMIIL